MVLLKFLMFFLKGASVIAGIHFLRYNPKDKATKFFVAFLALNFLVGIFSFIPRLIIHVELFQHLQTTFLNNDYWLYNPFIILSYSLYAWYFRLGIISTLRKQLLVVGIVILNIVGYTHMFYEGIFFYSHSILVFLMGFVLIITSISFYYYELLKSDKILVINKSIKMYISIGYLFYNLLCMPVWIYSHKYYNHLNPKFGMLYTFTIPLAHFLIYGIYIFAFLYCARKYKYIEN